MKRETIFKIITTVIGIALSLLVAEVVTRIYLFGSSAFSYDKMNSLVQLNRTEFAKASDNSQIFYEYEPNRKGYFRLVSFETNSLGWRDKEYELSKPKGVIRGAFVGDSFTMGAGVKMEDVFHTRMEVKLNKESTDQQYEFINFGVWGHGLKNYWGIMNERVLEYEPDFIVVSFCSTNDFLMPRSRSASRKYRVIENKNDAFSKSYLKKLYHNAHNARNSHQERKIKPEEVTYVNEMFAKFKRFGVIYDIPIIINYLTIQEATNNLEVIKKIALKNDLMFCDTGGQFKNSEVNLNRINVLDSHPNARANEVFANTLLSFKPLLDILYSNN